jgi:TolB protein
MIVAVAGLVLVGGLLVTPAFGIGDRLLSLIQGKQSPLDVQAPSWSPDGRTIVFVSWRDGNGEVYAMDADSSAPRNLTQHSAKDVRPAWSPDGRRIAFVSSRDRQPEIYVMNADGSGKRNLTRDRASDDFPTWSPDGRRIAFLRGRLHRPTLPPDRFYSYDLYVVNANGSGLRKLTRSPIGTHPLVCSPDGRTIHSGRHLVSTDGSGSRWLPYIPLTAVWSPDGRRIAFASARDTRDKDNPELYLMDADGSNVRRLTRTPWAEGPLSWSPDGRRLAFWRYPAKPRWAFFVMNADGSGVRKVTWSLAGRR